MTNPAPPPPPPPPAAPSPAPAPAPAPTIAIIGATGNLARHLANTLLSHANTANPHTSVGALILFTRRDTSPTRRWAAKQSPRVRLVRWSPSDESMAPEAIAARLREERVDAVVNALPPQTGALREAVVKGVALAAAGTGQWEGCVKVYFPPEFGLDERVGADAGNGGGGKEEAAGEGGGPFAVPEWEAKTTHHEVAREVLGPVGVRICRVHCGLFMHSAVGPWLGFHTARGVYSVVGPSGASTAYTDLGDVARAVAVLVRRACAGGDVPEDLRLAGSVTSVEEVREEMMDAGAGVVEIRTVPLEGYREKMLARRYEERSPFPYIKLIMASGLADWRPESNGGWGNDNELVNPGASLWRWKSIRDLAAETNGRPNSAA